MYLYESNLGLCMLWWIMMENATILKLSFVVGEQKRLVTFVYCRRQQKQFRPTVLRHNATVSVLAWHVPVWNANRISSNVTVTYTKSNYVSYSVHVHWTTCFFHNATQFTDCLLRSTVVAHVRFVQQLLSGLFLLTTAVNNTLQTVFTHQQQKESSK